MTLVTSIDNATYPHPILPASLVAQRKSIIGSSTYYGFTHGYNNLESDEKWAILRVYTVGGNEYFNWANNSPSYVNKWTLKTTYFSAAQASLYASISFDGSNDWILFGATPYYSLGKATILSISLWVRFGDLSSTQYIFTKNNSSAVGWEIQKISTSNLIRFKLAATSSTNDLTLVSTTAMLVNQWYHIVVTKDATGTVAGTKMYINGVLEIPSSSIDTLSSDPDYTGLLLDMGTRGSGSSPLKGFLDQVMIANHVFTQEQVSELYNGGSGLDGSLYSNYADVLSFWPLGESPDALGSGGIIDKKLIINGTMTNMLATNIVGSYPGGPI